MRHYRAAAGPDAGPKGRKGAAEPSTSNTQAACLYLQLSKCIWVVSQAQGVKVVATGVQPVQAQVTADATVDSVALNQTHQDDLEGTKAVLSAAQVPLLAGGSSKKKSSSS